MNKQVSLLLLGGLASIGLMSLSGCSVGVVDDGSADADPTKANITVATWDGGIGSDWLKTAAAKFEEKYKNATNFQTGRTGVKVNVKSSRSYDGDYMITGSYGEDIYFTEGISYYTVANTGKVADLTEIMTTPLTDYGEDKTILSKIDPNLAAFMKKDGKYYGIPFYDSFYGLVYDINIWQDYGLYLTDASTFTKDSTKFGKGPDGVSGTSDDGLPATYEDFAKLLKEMRDNDVTPFLGASNATDYLANFLYNYWADYEGKERMQLNYTFSGTADDLVSGVGGGAIAGLESKTINADNAYELQKQAGKFYALDFMNTVLAGDSKNYEILNTHTAAQSAFVKGRSLNKPKAMLVEGSWWENEAAGVFSALAKDGIDRDDYAIMPIPHPTSKEIGNKRTCLSLSSSYGMVSQSSTNKALALEFMKFLHTDEELSAFTKETSMTRALNYEVSATDQVGLTTYAKSILELKKNADVIYPYSSLALVINNTQTFFAFHWAWNSRISGSDYSNPWLYFTGIDGANYSDYFTGLYTYFHSIWNSLSK
jgi:ABC-type glycerol-3-phosphate transport system substrate-binding protein